MDLPAQRLEIRQKQPNALFEKWLSRWLDDAEKRNSKSQYRLKEALEALKSYPLPLHSGKECAILRGFGVKLCSLIDEELRHLQNQQPQANTIVSFHQEVQMVVASVKKNKNKSRKIQPTKLSKKFYEALAEEVEIQHQVKMIPGHFKIHLLVDTQETNGRSKRELDKTSGYLDALGVQYEIRRLTIGDFVWIACDESGAELVLPYIVERKRMDDLASSIRDGRYMEQKHRLRSCRVQNVIYLIEDYGKNERISLPLENLLQSMLNTQVQNSFKVIHKENHWNAMCFLKNMTDALIRIFKDKTLISAEKTGLIPTQPKDAIVNLMKFRDLYESSAKNAQLSVREVFMQQLLQLHSLTFEKAMAIVEAYPTPRLLFDAYESCECIQKARLLLSNIRFGTFHRCIGDKLSEIIFEFYNSEFHSFF